MTLIITPQAGHMVAASQVLLTKLYVSDLLTYGNLRCSGETCNTLSVGMCSMMNGCNSHGTCDEQTNGLCLC